MMVNNDLALSKPIPIPRGVSPIRGLAPILGLALSFGLTPLKTYAQNSFVATTFEEWHAGYPCAAITPNDVLGPGCHLATAGEQLHFDAAATLENLTFNAAAEEQISRDRCAAEQARALTKSPELFEKWRNILARTWAQRRKIRLMLDFCDEHFLRVVHPGPTTSPDALWSQWQREDRTQHQYPLIVDDDNPLPKNHALQEEREKTMVGWKDVCLDHASLQAMRLSEQTLPATVPLVSSTSMLDALDSHHGLITRFRDDQPLSDPELLHRDLRQFGRTDLQVSGTMDDELAKRLNEFADARATTAKALESKRSGSSFLLTNTQKQYIYDEGTFARALSDRPRDRPLANPGRAEACMAARWQASPRGEALDFAAGAIVTGGLYLAALRGIEAVAGATRLAKFARARSTLNLANVGRTAVASLNGDLGSTLVGCFANSIPYDPAKKPVNTAGLADLRPDVGYRQIQLAVKAADTPSCQGLQAKNLFLNSVANSSCAANAISDGVPALMTALTWLRKAPVAL